MYRTAKPLYMVYKTTETGNRNDNEPTPTVTLSFTRDVKFFFFLKFELYL